MGIVFAEVAGCLAARHRGEIPTVTPAVCRADGQSFAGTVVLANAIRNVEPLLQNPHKVANFGDLLNTLVVDVWLANNDRNLGNVLAQNRRDGKAQLTMIDFEKSVTLRSAHPTVESAAVPDRGLWPTGILGQLLRDRKGLHPPAGICGAINSVNEEEIRAILSSVSEPLGRVPWLESSIDVLAKRGRDILKIAERVWKLA